VTTNLRQGWNVAAVAVQHGHATPEFTYRAYSHFIADDVPERDGSPWGNKGATEAAETGRNAEVVEVASSAL
jgi:hypothetical protein